MNKSLVVAKHEMGQVLREPGLLIPYLIVPSITLVFFGIALKSGELGQDLLLVTTRILTILVGILITSMTLVLCADSFAGEKERNSLEILLCSPLSLRSLFIGKLLGVLPIPITLGWLAQLAVFILTQSSHLEVCTGAKWLQLVLLTPVSALFLCSLSVALSLRVTTVRAAAQLSGLVALIYLFAMQVLTPFFFEAGLFGPGLLIVLLFLGILVIWNSAVRFENLLFGK